MCCCRHRTSPPKHGLRYLIETYCHRKIQIDASGNTLHDRRVHVVCCGVVIAGARSCEDAIAALELVQLRLRTLRDDRHAALAMTTTTSIATTCTTIDQLESTTASTTTSTTTSTTASTSTKSAHTPTQRLSTRDFTVHESSGSVVTLNAKRASVASKRRVVALKTTTPTQVVAPTIPVLSRSVARLDVVQASVA
jgi:hypothetical protein